MTPERALITAGGILLFLGWLFLAARRPALPQPGTDAIHLRYSTPLRVFAWVTALGIPALLVVVMVYLPLRRPFNPWSAGALLLAFGILGGLLLLETEKVCISLTDQGIRGTSPWRGPREFPWNQVQDVSYSLLNRWFVLTSLQGQKIRVSCFLVGIRTFVAKLKQHVPPEKYVRAERGFGMI